MAKGKNTKGIRMQDDLMDNPIGNMTALLQMSQGCTMDKAYEQTLQELRQLLRPAHATVFDEADIIRARGMGVVLQFPNLRRSQHD